MTILYIDDDSDDGEIFCEAINVVAPNFECLTTTDIKSALEILKNKITHIIFLDYRMPNISAEGFLNAMKMLELKQSPKVYVYSTFMSQPEKENCIKLGVIDCFRKPGSFGDLCKLLRELLTDNQ